MPIGPLESFVFPGVFTRTVNEPPLASAAGNIRFPAFIGVGLEELRVSDFEMVRGSSSTADNVIIGEDVSSQFDGTNRDFTVTNFPIVKGNGRGQIANLPSEVIVLINNEQVAVSSVDGLTGVVTLVSVPDVGDVITANYFFKRRDTYLESEDLSGQADGTVVTFKVKSNRIVNGNNGGVSAITADIARTATIIESGIENIVPVISVTVDGSSATVSALSGSDATFTLSSAPINGALVVVNYFTNIYQDTYDILPAASVSRIVRTGLSSDTTDFSNGDDYVLTNSNRITWGQAYSIDPGVATVGSQAFDDDIITGSLIDNRAFKLKAAGTANSINKDFTLPSTPVKGDGLGTALEDVRNSTTTTYDDVRAYVGATVAAASEVAVLSIRGAVITLAVAPAAGNNVYVSYYQNLLVDEKWTFTNTLAGAVGVGTYTVVSNFRGDAKTLVAGSATSTITYPEATYSGSGSGSGTINAQIPPSKTIGNETVTVTFDGLGGFTVTSTLATGTGSGTINTGRVGQTYIDEVSGFRVTFASATSGNVTYVVTRSHTASASFQRSIPGFRFIVEDTSDVEVSDTAVVGTYVSTGNEPAIGDTYYVTFDQVKTDYSVKFMTNMSDVTRLFGPLSIDNKIVVAANLAFLNGARAIALKQVLKSSVTGDATTQVYLDAIDSFNDPLQNGARPSLLQVLTTNNDVITYLKSSNSVQSSIRYKNERTSYFGFAFGTKPEVASKFASGLKNEKITGIYPDGAVIALTDEFANEVEYIVGGEMIAAAMAGRDVSPITDIATPLTNASLVGLRRLTRRLDNVTAAQVAQSGLTVLEERSSNIRIRMALTTDLSTVLTRDPRIVEVKHFVQQGVRSALDSYIGSKFLPSVLTDIEKTLGAYFRALKQAQLIVDFKGIKATRNSSDPSTVDVEVFYSPVLPLNWVVVTLNLRSTLA